MNVIRHCIFSLSGIRDDPGYCTRSGDGGRTQINLCVGISHPSLEITVRGGEGDIPVSERTLMDSEATAAAGIHDDCAGVDQISKSAAFQCLLVNPP
jgi:hypothetical protein